MSSRVQILTTLVLGLNQASIPGVDASKCPFMAGGGPAGLTASVGAGLWHMVNPHPPRPSVGAEYSTLGVDYRKEFAKLGDLEEVKQDLRTLFLQGDISSAESEFWPADFGHYGPLMVRLAWHSAGSYRTFDGRGGANGARLRFEPERSWDDNTNLDKARFLLRNIKNKYGVKLSWSDLIILAGNTALEMMGTPLLGFCGGRLDDENGSESLLLGPTKEQREKAPCVDKDGKPAKNGECNTEKLGPTTVGLIYVNPEGHMGKPDHLQDGAVHNTSNSFTSVGPSAMADDIRNSFGRMGMDDEETVALIAGGHTFGKAHGACKEANGPSPQEVEENAAKSGSVEDMASLEAQNGLGWKGKCKNNASSPVGKGLNTNTSGLEGQWTTNPAKWDDHEFIRNLIDYEWEPHRGPGGAWQWRMKGMKNSNEPVPKGKKDLFMLTSDIALIRDRAYLQVVEDFAAEPRKFTEAFQKAWYKLTTRGPHARCIGPDVPEAQEFQDPLPQTPTAVKSVDWNQVRDAVRESTKESSLTSGGDFVRAAFSCASTFRYTDSRGGCDGGRLAQEPQKSWPANQGLDQVIDRLEAIREENFAEGASVADLLVYAGTAVIADAIDNAAKSAKTTLSSTVQTLHFCGGRSDAEPLSAKAEASFGVLEPRMSAFMNFLNTDVISEKELTPERVKDAAHLMGLSVEELTALVGGARALGVSHTQNDDVNVNSELKLNNAFFKELVENDWEIVENAGNTNTVRFQPKVHENRNDLLKKATKMDMFWKTDSQLSRVAGLYAANNDLFVEDFVRAWEKLMNADRFDGPTDNKCISRNGASGSFSRSKLLTVNIPVGTGNIGSDSFLPVRVYLVNIVNVTQHYYVTVVRSSKNGRFLFFLLGLLGMLLLVRSWTRKEEDEEKRVIVFKRHQSSRDSTKSRDSTVKLM